MTSPALTRESVARVGALVRATSTADRAHTGRGRVIALSEHAPVALVRWNCGCVSYVPLRRLTLDLGPPLAACEVSGCTNPRWEGPYCPSHPRGVRSTTSPVDASVEAGSPAGNGRPGHPEGAHNEDGARAPSEGGRGATGRAPERRPLPPSPRPRATGTAAASGGGGRSHAVASAPAAPRRNGPHPVWTRERIIAALQTWAREHGAAPNTTDWRRTAPGHPCFATIYPVFGTWDAALAAAGLERDLRRRNTPRWTRENVIAALRADYEANGCSPSTGSWAKATDDHPTKETVRLIFGTWSGALEAAGLPPAPLGRPRKRAA